MPIDEIEARLAVMTWQERVEAKAQPMALTTVTQHNGNRVTSHFYPEHWARVQLARHAMTQYAS